MLCGMAIANMSFDKVLVAELCQDRKVDLSPNMLNHLFDIRLQTRLLEFLTWTQMNQHFAQL
jgi:hypothetical protein